MLYFGDVGGAARPLLIGTSVLLGYRLPDAMVLSKARRRQEEIARALPDTIDQITVCVEAGLGFDAALKRVVETGSGPLNDELHRTLQEMRVGASRSRALAALAERTDALELHRFVAAMQQAEGYGLPITEMLRGHAHELRTRRRQRAEERALKLPVKLVFPLLFCVLPSLFVVTLGPAAIQMLQFMGTGGP
jgi:tight adherence protein C